MKTPSRFSPDVDDYITRCAPAAQTILQKIRALVHETVPNVEEKISYQMPAFFQNGILLYVGAFKHHIGLYPPVHDAVLQAEAAPYAGEKGNLKFSLDQPIPYELIQNIVKSRLKTPYKAD